MGLKEKMMDSMMGKMSAEEKKEMRLEKIGLLVRLKKNLRNGSQRLI